MTDEVDFSHLFTGSDEAESITVTPEYVWDKLAYIDSIDAHLDEGGGVSIENMRDLIGFARQFAKGYAQHSNILKVVIADREQIMASRNAANEELHRLRHPQKADRFAYWNSLPESEKAEIRQDFHNDMFGGADD